MGEIPATGVPPPNRKGQTAAYCAKCGGEITEVAYVVQVRDVTRLTTDPMWGTILHYNCIAAMFAPDKEA